MPLPLPLLDEVDDDHRAAVPLQQLVEVPPGRHGVRVLGLEEDRRLGLDLADVLRPVARHAAPHLDERRVPIRNGY